MSNENRRIGKMESFAARLNAAEGSFFRSEQRQATIRHIEKLVDQGKLPEATLSGLEASTFAHAGFQDIPVTVINSKPASEVRFSRGSTNLSISAFRRIWPVLVALAHLRSMH